MLCADIVGMQSHLNLPLRLICCLLENRNQTRCSQALSASISKQVWGGGGLTLVVSCTGFRFVREGGDGSNPQCSKTVIAVRVDVRFVVEESMHIGTHTRCMTAGSGRRNWRKHRWTREIQREWRNDRTILDFIRLPCRMRRYNPNNHHQDEDQQHDVQEVRRAIDRIHSDPCTYIHSSVANTRTTVRLRFASPSFA